MGWPFWDQAAAWVKLSLILAAALVLVVVGGYIKAKWGRWRLSKYEVLAKNQKARLLEIRQTRHVIGLDGQAEPFGVRSLEKAMEEGAAPPTLPIFAGHRASRDGSIVESIEGGWVPSTDFQMPLRPKLMGWKSDKWTHSVCSSAGSSASSRREVSFVSQDGTLNTLTVPKPTSAHSSTHHQSRVPSGISVGSSSHLSIDDIQRSSMNTHSPPRPLSPSGTLIRPNLSHIANVPRSPRVQIGPRIPSSMMELDRKPSVDQDTPHKPSVDQSTAHQPSSSQDTSHKSSTEQDTPHKSSSDQDTPHKSSTEQDAPQKSSIEQGTPPQSSIDRDTLHKPSIDQHTLNQLEGTIFPEGVTAILRPHRTARSIKSRDGPGPGGAPPLAPPPVPKKDSPPSTAFASRDPFYQRSSDETAPSELPSRNDSGSSAESNVYKPTGMSGLANGGGTYQPPDLTITAQVRRPTRLVHPTTVRHGKAPDRQSSNPDHMRVVNPGFSVAKQGARGKPPPALPIEMRDRIEQRAAVAQRRERRLTLEDALNGEAPEHRRTAKLVKRPRSGSQNRDSSRSRSQSKASAERPGSSMMATTILETPASSMASQTIITPHGSHLAHH